MAPDVASVRAMLREKLAEDDVAHCDRVAETAARLARAYGVDEDAARMAGSLHDVARRRDGAVLLGDAVRLGLRITDADRDVPYLLHARVGAAEAAERFPDLPRDVLDAIACHTLGARSMTPLSMVVHVADMIEPARAYPGVEVLRASVGRVELEELFKLAYQQTLGYLVRARRRIHPHTVTVYNALVAEDRP
ncbi:MAG: bis(5'-nucleosyl)-tetraphosphatase (symmetrical) YqeK [Coriobacteriia bacterium]